MLKYNTHGHLPDHGYGNYQGVSRPPRPVAPSRPATPIARPVGSTYKAGPYRAVSAPSVPASGDRPAAIPRGGGGGVFGPVAY